MSSGFFAAAVVLAATLMACSARRSFGLRAAAACALLAAVCVAGALSSVHVPGHDALRAHSAREWLGAAASALSWPLVMWPASFLILQAPIVMLAVGRIRRHSASGDEAALLALAAWISLQIAAIAYARQGLGVFRSSRYMDHYSLLAVVNALALAILCARRPLAAPVTALAAAWACVFLGGLWNLNRTTHEFYLDRYPGLKAEERHHVRAFLADGDLDVLRAAPGDQLPYPNPDRLGRLLSEPGIRRMLPVGIRPALVLEADTGTTGFEREPRSQVPPGAPGTAWVAHRGPARFVSQPLPLAILPFLHELVAGSADLDASMLRLETDGSEPSAAKTTPLGPQWKAIDLAVPEEVTVRLVAEIPPGEHWLAFTEPVELGPGSLANRWLLRHSAPIAAAGGILFLCALAALLVCDSPGEPPEVPASG
jgi:hypothetical protein